MCVAVTRLKCATKYGERNRRSPPLAETLNTMFRQRGVRYRCTEGVRVEGERQAHPSCISFCCLYLCPLILRVPSVPWPRGPVVSVAGGWQLAGGWRLLFTTLPYIVELANRRGLANPRKQHSRQASEPAADAF